MATLHVRSVARLAITTLLAAVALSGCVRLTSDTTVADNDTFSQTAIIATTAAARSQLGSMGGIDLDDLKSLIVEAAAYQELSEQYPGHVSVEDYEDGDLTGVQITTTDLPLEAFEASFAQLSSSLPLTGNATLVRAGDTYVITIPSGQAADMLAQAGISGNQLELLGSQVDVGFTFSFPGLVTSATAGDVEGNSVTLDVADLASGADITIVAGANKQVNWKPWLTWGGVALAALVIIGGATALIVQDVRRHRTTELPPPDAAAGEVAAGPGILGSAGDATSAGEATPEATQEDTEP